MEEFIVKEGGADGQFPIPEEDVKKVIASSKECDKRAKSDMACDHIWDWLEKSAFVPQFNSSTCIVFDEEKFTSGEISTENEKKSKDFCAPREVSFNRCISHCICNATYL